MAHTKTASRPQYADFKSGQPKYKKYKKIIQYLLFKGDDLQRRSSNQLEESCISDRSHDKLDFTEERIPEQINELSVESPNDLINVLGEMAILSRESSV